MRAEIHSLVAERKINQGKRWEQRRVRNIELTTFLWMTYVAVSPASDSWSPQSSRSWKRRNGSWRLAAPSIYAVRRSLAHLLQGRVRLPQRRVRLPQRRFRLPQRRFRLRRRRFRCLLQHRLLQRRSSRRPVPRQASLFLRRHLRRERLALPRPRHPRREKVANGGY